MGAWGHEPFDNDTAMDWSYDLEESSDLSVLTRSLQPAPGYLEADQGTELVAAAAVVAGALHPVVRLPENIQNWLQRHATLEFASLKVPARAGIDRVLGADSELRELWEESEENFSAWQDCLQKLTVALA